MYMWEEVLLFTYMVRDVCVPGCKYVYIYMCTIVFTFLCVCIHVCIRGKTVVSELNRNSVQC